jgi:tetratricopeptide (TPR) repeat protein
MNFRLLSVILLSASTLAAREAKWTRLEAGNFTIISEVSEEETKNWAVEFDQFHHGLGKVLRIHESLLQPVTVVLFRSQDELEPYKPLEKGKPANVDGMFIRSPLGNYIEAAADSEDQQTRHLIFHEGVHWMTNVSDIIPPLWLDEGLAEVFSTFSTDDNLYNYGQAIPYHVILLRRDGLMPLKKLLAIQHGSLLYNEGERTSIFYAESWAFVHYLLFSGNLEERSKYNELVRALRTGGDPDMVFKELFGVDCAGMDKKLREYLNYGDYTIVRIKFDRAAVVQSFKIRPASAIEVDLAKSSLLAVVSRPSEALPRLLSIASRSPENTGAWEAAGYAAYASEDYDETDRCFQQAARHGSRNYFVYSFLGDSTLGVRPGTLSQKTNGDMRLAIDYYEHELSLNPRDEHAYANIAGNGFGLDPLKPIDAAFMRQGVRLYPDNPLIRLGTTVVDLRQGDAAAAMAALQAAAADTRPGYRDAAVCARAIVDYQMRLAAADRLAAQWQNNDFTGVIATIDTLLKTAESPADRDNLLNSRVRAEVAIMVAQAIELAQSGHLAQARPILIEASQKATDLQMQKQIQGLLDKVNAYIESSKQSRDQALKDYSAQPAQQ